MNDTNPHSLTAQSPFLTIMLCTLCFISAMRFGSFNAAARSLGSGTAMPRCKKTVLASQCCQGMLPHILAPLCAARLEVPVVSVRSISKAQAAQAS